MRAVIRRVLGDDPMVWVFGSRVDDGAKGGDIDLYVELDASPAILAQPIAPFGATRTPIFSPLRRALGA
jgi:predicted nucleotidyltransferase